MNHLLDADSKQTRLTNHAVGFKNAKSQAGANSTPRDNDLLSRRRTSNSEKNQKQSPASPVCPASPAGGSRPAGSFPPWDSQGRKHPTGAPPSSGTTNYSCGELPNHLC
jgi:hypothetical protein